MSRLTDVRRSQVRTLAVGLLMIAVTGGAVVSIAATRRGKVATESAQRSATVAKGITVSAALAAAPTGTREIVAQGEAAPYLTVTLYAKVSGYLKRIMVDKGDHVVQGQVLAEIESPETDQALLAAVADARYKRLNADRAAPLVAKKFISIQEADLAEAEARVAEARVTSLTEQKGFELLRAPFTGSITARYADPGALVQNAANNETSAQPVVTIADVNRLRVRLYLDQRSAATARRGMPVEIQVADRPTFRLRATISRITQALDQKTRTLLAEVDVDNRAQQLVAGSYVDVHLRLPTVAVATIPVEGVVMRGDKHYVAVLDTASRVHLHEVVVGDTDGRHIDILSGIKPGDRVALNLGEKVSDGSLVQVDTVSPTGSPQ